MNNLLEMKHVAVNFAAYGGTVQAVRDISFSIEEGQTVALVGESGCGKSVSYTHLDVYKRQGVKTGYHSADRTCDGNFI